MKRHEDEEELERLLRAALQPTAAPPALARDVAGIPARLAQRRPLLAGWLQPARLAWGASAAAMAASLLLGLLLGMGELTADDTFDEVQDLTALVLAAPLDDGDGP